MNARLINEDNVIPFLASTVIPKGLDEKLLAQFNDPTPEDVEDYGHLVGKVFAALKKLEEADSGQQAPPRLTPSVWGWRLHPWRLTPGAQP